MLKLVKPIGSKDSSYHEEVFVQQYDRLLERALRITQGDRVAAEDLVQEAFVQFTFTRPNLDSIKYLDAYLYGMLRNLHLMDLRRATHRRNEPLALIDFDSVEIGLRSRDLSQAMQTKNELALICRYACQRKRTSKAGSVLILRFFHGYYPSEISQVIQSSRSVVSELLVVGRKEARLFTEDPRSLSFLGEPNGAQDITFEAGLSYSEILGGLRKSVFRSRTGACLSTAELEAIFRVARPAPVDVEILDHVVSCGGCLDSVNELLNLPLLAERNPTDMLSPNKPPKGPGSGSDGPDDPGSGSPHLEDLRQKFRRRARSVFEHEPRELCVSVNGDRQYWQKIASSVSEQAFSLEPSDNIELIEISSEQGIRLLMLQVEQTPYQSADVALSEGRMLRVSLDRSTSRPLLRVFYEDPNYFNETEAVTSRTAETGGVPANTGWRNKLRASLASLAAALTIPKVTTATVVLLLILGFLLFRSHKPTEKVSVPLADELLRRSVSAEEAYLTRTDTVLHRSIKVERRELTPNSQSDQASVHKIEIWRSAEKGVTARRLFTQQDQLVAGLWQRSDGVLTLYQHGKAPEIKLPTTNQLPISSETFWQEEPTAEAFKRIVGTGGNDMTVEELASTYLISYAPTTVANGQPIKASVVLAKADLHVTEMTIVVNEPAVNLKSTAAPRLVEYHFTESSFERHSPSTVSSSVFEPEKELLNSGTNRVSNAAPALPALGLPNNTSRPFATADLEVELLRLLHEVGADLGEQITVTRTPDGSLRVFGVVETEQRKLEILSVLKSVSDSQRVAIDLETVAEALERQARLSQSGAPATLEQAITSEPATMPLENDLRQYYSREGKNADELARQFAMRVVTRSRNAMTHIYALKRLLHQFSEEEFKELSADAKVKWLGLLQAHARAFKSEVDLMCGELQPVFFAEQSLSVSSDGSTNDAATTIATAEQLVNLATANDLIIRYSLTTSPNSSSRQTIKNREFWESLEQTRRLAAIIVGARQ